MTNDLIEKNDSDSAGTAIATTRQAQEVQAAMIVAKRFPRDEDWALAKILKSCQRRGLAEVACYEYSKGGTKITGPSIRLAEVLAQSWGNLDFGFSELERRSVEGVGQSLVQCVAWDLETNTRRAVTFTVRHWRDTKGGGYALTDERDIYELVANQAARRVRACIMAVIPGDIQDAAVEQCEKTMTAQSKEPLGDRIAKMLTAFDSVGVTVAAIEAKLGHNTASITATELARMAKVYQAIRDGVSKAAEHFPLSEEKGAKPRTLDALAKSKQPQPPIDDNHPQLLPEGTPILTAADRLANYRIAINHASTAAECDALIEAEVPHDESNPHEYTQEQQRHVVKLFNDRVALVSSK